MALSQKPVRRRSTDPSTVGTTPVVPFAATSARRVDPVGAVRRRPDGLRGGLRGVALAAVVVLLAVAGTGCLTGEVSVKIDGNGSGKIDIELLPYDELQKLLVDTKAVPIAERAIENYDGATFESTTVDGRIAYRAHLPFDDYRDLVDVMTDGVEIMGLNLRVFSEFTLTEVDGNWRLDATPAPELLSDALRADPSLQQLLDSEGIVALNSDLRLTIALPGQIIRTNGDQIASGTARWSLKKDVAPRITMLTEPKPLLTFVQKIFLGAFLAIILGVVLNLWGSRTSWQSGRTERRERKRAKRLTFGPKRAGETSARWDNSGPIAPAMEGTVPDSGPMPPREIPTLRDSTSAAGATPIVTPPISNLPPVAPPVAPTVDPNVPDPFAPHRPGQSTGEGVGLDAAHQDLGAPISPPVAPPVDPNMPDPFAPHVPGAPVSAPQDPTGVVPPAAPAPPATQAEAPAPPPPAAPVPPVGAPAPAPAAPAPPTTRAAAPAPPPPPPVEPTPAMFDLHEDDDAPATSPVGGFEPAMFDLDDAGATTSEEHHGFSFDGTPGWFSSETEGDAPGVGSDASGATAPEPASLPEPGTSGSPTFMPDPAFSAAAAEADLGPVDSSADQDSGPEDDVRADQGPVPRADVPAAWYPDPDDPDRYRWWDGDDWTDYVSGGDS